MVILKKHFYILLLSISFLTQAQQTKDSIDIFLQQKMQELHIPGLQLAVIKKGQIIKTGNYGLANIEHDVSVTNESVFSINSITKVFTGIAIMQLAEEGKLKIDDPLSRHLDNLPAAWQNLTLQQLLTHTSGIPNIIDAAERVVGNGDEESAWEIVKTLPMEFKPGEKFSYNQSGYVLLGQIISKLSGMHFTKFIEERQFKIVGMKQTCFGDSYDIIPHYAGSYTTIKNIDGRWVSSNDLKNTYVGFPVFFRTATGILSTATEMAKWIIAVQDGTLLKQKESLNLLWTPAILNNGGVGGSNSLTNGYALGWPTVTRHEHPAVGPLGGRRSAFFTYLNDDLSIVVLTNLQGSDPEWFIDKIAAYYIPDMKESNGFGLSASAKKLRTELLKKGYDKASEIAVKLKKKDASFKLTENELNDWGYKLLRQDKKAEAFHIFKLNVKLYPQSGNTYDSLGEVYELMGNRKSAIENYKRSLELDPHNTNASNILKKLETK
ncbi:serine hydrolase [Flavobacterium cerinum]|uniref:Serine hydrolase n=1 Tax=Flavobacterium cerinum TaxID=2502784 RepID=A0A444HEF3_9FLAO|nr:serine hydrolase [Flavobacterium cerinum]RWX02588.1 serine hydrolase [Flavobacterium cerinum]